MTQGSEPPASEFDWRVTSFEDARREQLRRWARLPLEEILLAIKEMQILRMRLGPRLRIGLLRNKRAEDNKCRLRL